MRPESNGPIKYPKAKHCDNKAKANPFLLIGAILNTISVEVGRKEDVPILNKTIAIIISVIP